MKLEDILDKAGSEYCAAIKVIGYCNKDDLPADFLSLAVKELLHCDEQTGDIFAKIEEQNESFALLDLRSYNQKAKIFCSISDDDHQKSRRLYNSEAGIIKAALLRAYESYLDLQSYYSKKEFLAVEELQYHILTYWNFLSEDEKHNAQELWIHYSWISNYYLSSGCEAESQRDGPYKFSSFALRLKGDRLSNSLEDGDFQRENLIDFIADIQSPEVNAIISNDLILRSRISVFLLELYNFKEGQEISNTYQGMPIPDYAAETISLLEKELEGERSGYAVFCFEHICMILSLISIGERITSSKELVIAASERNQKVIDFCSSVRDKYPVLKEYDSEFLKMFALNLRTVPRWEKPLFFIEVEGCTTEIEVLEAALETTTECLKWYETIHFYERTETELGNLFDICGKLAKAYKDAGDSTKRDYYRQESIQYLNRRKEEREKNGYLSPEFLCSFYYKKYMLYSQYCVYSETTSEERKHLYSQALNAIDEWGKVFSKDTKNGQSRYYRMKGILYRKLMENNLYLSDHKENELFDTAVQCFQNAIKISASDASICIINTIEWAYTLKSYSKLSEAQALLDSIKNDVEQTHSWSNAYNLACRRCSMS